MFVVAEVGDKIVALLPEIFVHRYEEIVPSVSAPVPASVTLFAGKVIVLSDPALAVGATFAAAFTITVTWSVPMAPALSVTFNW